MHHKIHTPIVAIIFFLEHESYKLIHGENYFYNKFLKTINLIYCDCWITKNMFVISLCKTDVT